MAAAPVMKQAFYRLPPLPTPADILRFYRLRALKQLSQNFLLDPRICAKVVRAAGKLKGAHVVEVGPGPGCLTRPIFEQGAESVVVVEKDRRFLPALELLAEATEHRLKVVHGDILLRPLDDLIPAAKATPWEDHPPDIHLIGNLPFSVSTILVVRWMQMVSERSGAWKHGRVRMTLTFQKEVARRLGANDADPEKCRLSILAQGYCHVKECFTIAGGSFVPPPEVDSGVVRLIPRKEPVFRQRFELVEKVLRCLFNTKRKSIRRTLRNLIPEPLCAELVPQIMTRSDIDPELVTMMLTVEDFSRICDEYASLCEQIDGLYNYNYRQNSEPRQREATGEQSGLVTRRIITCPPAAQQTTARDMS